MCLRLVKEEGISGDGNGNEDEETEHSVEEDIVVPGQPWGFYFMWHAVFATLCFDEL